VQIISNDDIEEEHEEEYKADSPLGFKVSLKEKIVMI